LRLGGRKDLFPAKAQSRKEEEKQFFDGARF
jgi:hypothetical protein